MSIWSEQHLHVIDHNPNGVHKKGLGGAECPAVVAQKKFTSEMTISF